MLFLRTMYLLQLVIMGKLFKMLQLKSQHSVSDWVKHFDAWMFKKNTKYAEIFWLSKTYRRNFHQENCSTVLLCTTCGRATALTSATTLLQGLFVFFLLSRVASFSRCSLQYYLIPFRVTREAELITWRLEAKDTFHLLKWCSLHQKTFTSVINAADLQNMAKVATLEELCISCQFRKI